MRFAPAVSRTAAAPLGLAAPLGVATPLDFTAPRTCRGLRVSLSTRAGADGALDFLTRPTFVFEADGLAFAFLKTAWLQAK